MTIDSQVSEDFSVNYIVMELQEVEVLLCLSSGIS
jgi:hypothetical protein